MLTQAEYKTPQGRSYWFHTQERRSVWEKPAELKSARERALDETPWREYKSGGRIYYVHKDTKESSWTIPADLQERLDAIPDAPPAVVALRRDTPQAAPSPHPGSPGVGTPQPDAGHASPAGAASGNGRSTPQPAAFNLQPVFTNANDAEVAFMKLLRDKRVDVSWTWEQTIREIVMEPMYKAFKTLAERKAAFTKYIDQLRALREEDRKEKEAYVRPLMVKALQANGGLKPYASFATFRKRLHGYSFWDELEGDEELAVQLYESIRKDVRAKQEAAERAVKEHNRTAFTALLASLDLQATSRWRDVHRAVLASDKYKHDAKLQTMPLVEMLPLFEERMKEVDAAARSELEAEQRARLRTARLARDAFRALLQERIAKGSMTARSTWAATVPALKDDERLTAVLSVEGSAPHDLFYDTLDELERGFAKHMKSVQALLDAHPVALEEEHYPAFLALVHGSDAPESLRTLPVHEVREVFEELVYQAHRAHRESRRRKERRLRHYVDDLRHAMKAAAPPLDTTATFEAVVPRLQMLPEFGALEKADGGHDAARAAWERFVQREQETPTPQRGYRDWDETADDRKRKPDLGAAPPMAPDPRAVRRRMRYDEAES